MKRKIIKLKLLVAMDGSAHSKILLKNISNRIFPKNTEMRIISVYQIAPVITGLEQVGIYQQYYDATNKFSSEKTQKIVEKAANELRAKMPALNITTKILGGSPQAKILEEAENFKADLIIVGSHGSNTLQRYLLGSVSHAVALHAKCSVEIVR